MLTEFCRTETPIPNPSRTTISAKVHHRDKENLGDDRLQPQRADRYIMRAIDRMNHHHQHHAAPETTVESCISCTYIPTPPPPSPLFFFHSVLSCSVLYLYIFAFWPATGAGIRNLCAPCGFFLCVIMFPKRDWLVGMECNAQLGMF